MTTHKYDYEQIEDWRAMGWSWEDVATQHPGTTAKQVRQAWHQWKKRNHPDAPNPAPAPSGDDMTAERNVRTGMLTGKSRTPMSPEDLLELCGMDPDEWTITKARPGYSTMGSKDETGRAVTTRLYNMKLWTEPAVSADAVNAVRDHVLEEMRSASAARARPHALENPPQDPKLAELVMMDVHLGMLSWRHETGVDWDLRIVEDVIRESVDRLLDEAAGQSIGAFLLPIGNDFYHTDAVLNGKVPTTHAGTPQDVDGRWQKAYRLGYDLMVWTVDRLLEIAPVKIVGVPGNHDRTKAWHLVELLDARYHAEPLVEVDNRPTPRKYHAYGNTLLGFCHGDEEKPADLPLIMAREAPGAWGAARFHEWHMGHWHHDMVKEYKGVKCRYLPPLTPQDNWHTVKGHVGNVREAQLHVWSLDRGRTATFHHTVTQDAEQLRPLGPDASYVGTPTR